MVGERGRMDSRSFGRGAREGRARAGAGTLSAYARPPAAKAGIVTEKDVAAKVARTASFTAETPGRSKSSTDTKSLSCSHP